MINIYNKVNCCGCNACVQICPQKCIIMEEDYEGFLYPKIELQKCINCRLCEKVCPVLNRFSSSTVLDSYACYTYNEYIQERSSSGGILYEMSKYILEKKGIVCGACFDENWEVFHSCADNVEDSVKFRGSKYVQSKIGDVYSHVKDYLKKGKYVLFIGTPCQVSGLNHFLLKKYENLITVDIICHSVPSPKVWRYYLAEISRYNSVTNVQFRDKSNGWKNYSIKVNSDDRILLHEGKKQNLYMRGFLEDLYTRPSCSDCPARNYTSGSDFTIGDFWGCEKYYSIAQFEKGCSIVLINTVKGKTLFFNMKENFYSVPVPYEYVEPYGLHKPLTSSSKPHYNREYFYKNLEVTKSIRFLIFKWIIVLELKKRMKTAVDKCCKCFSNGK